MAPERETARTEISEGHPDGTISHRQRSQITRAAILKPLNLIMLLIGGIFFATTTSWWILPLTLITYVLLILIAIRDPIFQRRVIEHKTTLEVDSSNSSKLSPERRARWLPRGETRRTVEEALDAYRKLVAAIEDSSDATRSALSDTVPRLHAAANRLVEVAHHREKVAESAREIKSKINDNPKPDTLATLNALSDKIKSADEEIEGTYDRMFTLRTHMIGVSLNSEIENRAAAQELNRSLDELNYRLEALGELNSDTTPTQPWNNDS